MKNIEDPEALIRALKREIERLEKENMKLKGKK